eukprot:CAMPEP_0180661876 /NCGR_PEP_ID=MMETSP1037_2-20121125/59080_1 /TAXON_ID=632150 /ORGANISM="Azadinium spinosum, Strain 3D9" /LENGTH=38 /DNA_ID= /DNA_START= /DNA_END= /DNA_ORIENTATION=
MLGLGWEVGVEVLELWAEPLLRQNAPGGPHYPSTRSPN